MQSRSYFLFSLVLLLFIVSGYLTFIVSPEISAYFGFKDLNTYFIKQLYSMVIGVFIIFFIARLDVNVWFNRIGVAIFIFSLIVLVLMLVVPNSMTPYILARKLYLVVAGVAINPMLFFPIGSLWLISYLVGMKKNIKVINYTLFSLMIVSALFCIEFSNMRALFMLETFFICILLYLNGINRYTIISLSTVAISSVIFIFMAEHRVLRIKSWLALSTDYMTNLSVDALLHENILLTTIDRLGMFTFIFMVLLFVLLSYMIASYKYAERSYKIFALGVVLLILLNLASNVLYVFELVPIYPQTLYFIGYGYNIIIASSIMIGAVLMLQNRSFNEGKTI